MRVVILGSGVVGVTSAWYLAKEGHDVTVIDRQDGRTLGGPRRSSESDQMDVSAPCALGYPFGWQQPPVTLDVANAEELRYVSLYGQQKPYGPSGGVQP